LTANSIRRSRKHPWRPRGAWITARKAVQYLALLSFFVLFLATRDNQWPAAFINFPLRLDPLLVISHLLASRTFLLSSSLALVLLISTLIVGRGWCGWLCPLGTILDIFSLTRWRRNRRPPPEKWRGIKYGLLLVILMAALFGNLTLLVMDPLTILIRSLVNSIWPAFNQIFTFIESFLYQIPLLAEPITKLDGIIRPVILPPEPVYYRNAVLFALLFLGVIALNVLAHVFGAAISAHWEHYLEFQANSPCFAARLVKNARAAPYVTNPAQRVQSTRKGTTPAIPVNARFV
jgi:hypothetical protein